MGRWNRIHRFTDSRSGRLTRVNGISSGRASQSDGPGGWAWRMGLANGPAGHPGSQYPHRPPSGSRRRPNPPTGDAPPGVTGRLPASAVPSQGHRSRAQHAGGLGRPGGVALGGRWPNPGGLLAPQDPDGRLTGVTPAGGGSATHGAGPLRVPSRRAIAGTRGTGGKAPPCHALAQDRGERPARPRAPTGRGVTCRPGGSRPARRHRL